MVVHLLHILRNPLPRSEFLQFFAILSNFLHVNPTVFFFHVKVDTLTNTKHTWKFTISKKSTYLFFLKLFSKKWKKLNKSKNICFFKLKKLRPLELTITRNYTKFHQNRIIFVKMKNKKQKKTVFGVYFQNFEVMSDNMQCETFRSS